MRVRAAPEEMLAAGRRDVSAPQCDFTLAGGRDAGGRLGGEAPAEEVRTNDRGREAARNGLINTAWGGQALLFFPRRRATCT